MAKRKVDETPFVLTEAAHRDMYHALPKGTVLSGDEVKEYGFEKIAKRATSKDDVVGASQASEKGK